MIKKYVIPGAFFLFMLTSCSNEKAKSEALIEANKVHLESVKIHESVEKEIAEKNKRATESNESRLLLKLDSVHHLVELWEDGIVEVPGFEHEHHHGKGEPHHEHKAVPQMTDESMLEYQQNTKMAIQELQMSLKQL